ncbi:hypothetical protein Ae201684P_016609 [Aphanomyces euteiches]|nr:hypothetical protein Ae201684P_016609 [Aphanomyces euteiches]
MRPFAKIAQSLSSRLLPESDDEELPTRLTEEDLIVPVLDEPIPVSTFPIGESGPAAHFYRTYYQGTPSPPRFPPPSP